VGRIALGVFLACCRPSFALNPSLDIDQYAHTSWPTREGHFRGTINSIAQTPDGYVWLGTEFGLVRFDGVRTTPWTPPDSEGLPDSLIRYLIAARDGTLWIGTQAGLASWDGSRIVHYPQLDGKAIGPLLEDRVGTVWAGVWAGGAAGSGRLCAIRSGEATCYGNDGSLGNGVTSLYEDGAGNLWAGAASGLWLWRPGPPRRFAMPNSDITGLAQTENGKLLIAMRGVMQLENGEITPYRIAGASGFSAVHLLRDHDGGLWIGTRQGLVHLHQGRTDVFSRRDGLCSDDVRALFEDREGSVWVATDGGLDRFREVPVFTLSAKQGLSGNFVTALLAARDGSVWLAGPNGLDRWKNGQVTTFRRANGLPDDETASLFEDDGGRIWAFSAHGLAQFQQGTFVRADSVPGGSVWFINGDGADGMWLCGNLGLLHVREGHLAEEIAWSRFGGRGMATVVTADRERGGLWLGFPNGGLAYLKDGQVEAGYTGTGSLGRGIVSGLELEPKGGLWVASTGGLSIIRRGRVATLSSANGLPCDTVYWKVEANDRSNWLYMPCGLVRVEQAELDAWEKDPKRRIEVRVFDESDGVMTHSFPATRSSPVARSTDGKIWFVSHDGVSVFDPAHLPFNKLPPPVHIERIAVDDKPFELRPGMRLPANPRYVTIDYTALSLVVPEKVRFKYKLEGQDRDWREVVNERKVQYSNLGPRAYRFRVIACNNSGVWNETGDTLEFSIAPAWNQTTWFYASCVGAFLAMLWGLYRLRLYQIAREFNAQLDGRVDERLRVARELHDTLLQSFQASLIRMQAARNVFARRPEKAVESLDAAITMAAGAVAEGRSAIQDLRVHPAGGGDLAQLLTAAGQELAHSEEAPENPPVFRLTVEGERRDLEPLLQDEVYRIARELLRNAFRHAQAGRIEAEIRYESRQLRLHVRDDGKGIDPEVLKTGGCAGHWGLPGMRERVDRFGGKLEFWSEAGAGTEAVLTVPAAAAYGASNGGAFSFLRRKKAHS
jgi:signal transduction histidine kinase/ligand-binding sensor domain-containing protein